MTTSSQHLPDQNSKDTVIDVSPIDVVVAAVEVVSTDSQSIPVARTESIPASVPTSNGALVTTRGNFSNFLAPLKKDTFKEVVTDVENKLQVVNQTLSMLDNLMDAQGFDAILDEMLRSITLKTGELLNADRTTIFLLDEDKHELWAIVAKDERGNNLELRIPMNAGIAGEVATKRQRVNIPYDFYDDPRSEAAKKLDKKNHYRTYTMLAMPLLNEEDKLVAVVQLINKLKLNHASSASLEEKIDLDGFTLEDEQVFEEFAPSIRLIIESSRSFYKATQQQRAASALMKATQSLSQSSLDLEETLKRVMDEAKELMQADRSTLWLLDRDRDQLWTKIPIGGVLQELRIPMAAGFAGLVASTGEPLLIPFDLYEHPNSQTSKETDQKTSYRTCSMLCMPVFNADGELIAVTQLVNKKRQGDYPPYDPTNYPEAPDVWRASFNRADQEFMQAFNIQAGVALQNAKLFETVRQQEQLQRDILRSLTNGVISTDKNGNIIAANESAKCLLGFDEQESLAGISVVELVKVEKKDFKGFSACLEKALVPEEAEDREQEYEDLTLQPVKGTEQHSINLSISTIVDANDSITVSGALVVMDDISDEKRLKTTMSRYMSEDLAEQLIKSGNAELGGKRIPASVLFSDIRSYTSITETLTAEEVVEMLNRYFEPMVDAVFRHKGTLDKYIGDAIMAVFGSPLPLDNHEWMAVQTAIEMRQRLTEFNEAWVAEDPQKYKPIRIGIGINSDEVISGNIGSSKRMEFTAIGDGVNLGSRLEGASKQYGTDIIISENTYLPCADKVWARELDYIKVKGKDQPVKIYELIGLHDQPISDEQKRIIDHYQQARTHYLDRNFPLALAEFGQVLSIDKDNKAASLHLQRCQHWLQNPPADNWDGSWTLTDK
ncbi:MAG: GAF domain-containing protein [Leptolyngbyaceae cyanobacterium bins.302]|nr:GAF domain-containing protein [Leptolyngbyaceae cyanobacterium bins.302]